MSHWPAYKFMNFRKAFSPKSTTKMSNAFHNLMSKFIEPYEAAGPVVASTFPGPKALQYNERISHT